MSDSETARPPTAAPRQAPAVIAAHWATAFLLLAVFALVLVHDRFDDTLWRQALMQGHRWAGLMVWALAVVRLFIRGRVGLRDDVATLSTAQRLAALAVQGLMYALLLGLPLLGWLLTNARGQPVVLPGGWPLPVLLTRDLDLADTLEQVHAVAAWGLAALAGLHMAAAIWHHRVRRDALLVAMWPGLRQRA